MFFDDRLATVLRHRAASEHAARTQFRQLLDLMGNRKYGRDESLIAAAWLRLAALAELIPAAERASMVREPGWRFRSTELAARLAEDHPKVAAAALARADLRSEDWRELIPRLPVRARGFLRLRRDLPEDISPILEQLGIHDRGLPQPEVELPPEVVADKPESMVGADDTIAQLDVGSDDEVEADDILNLTEIVEEMTPATARENTGPKSEIAALVERISNFRKGQEPPQVPHDQSPRLPLEDEAGIRQYSVPSFGFIADVAGRIEWADEQAAPMVIGKRLLPPKRLGTANSRDPIIRAFSSCQPIERAEITLSGASAIEGRWFIDAQPRFLGSSGRFHGYIGRFRRPAPIDETQTPAAREADRIRQLLHELRTPVNALQGFAEVIQQQLFGPAPNEYRALAANIAGDAARILAGFDELERLAKLEGGAMILSEGESDLGPLVERMVNQLQQVLSSRMAGFDLAPMPDTPSCISMAEEDAEALVWRLLATLAGACTAGEALEISLTNLHGIVRLQSELPAQLAAEEDIFSAKAKSTTNGLSAGLFGAGFSLRLVRAEVNSAGGDLVNDDDRITLTIPHRPAQQAPPSEDSAPEGRNVDRKPAKGEQAKAE